MKGTKHTIRIGLASLLLVMVLALGGLTMTNTATGGGIATLLSAVETASQKIVANHAVAVKSADSSATNQTTSTSTAQQTQQAPQEGVVDATHAVQQAGSAVVTIVNTMQLTTTGRGRFGFGGQGQTVEALGSGVII